MNPLAGTVSATQSDVLCESRARTAIHRQDRRGTRSRERRLERSGCRRGENRVRTSIHRPWERDRHWRERGWMRTHALGLAITSLTFPSGAIAGVDRVGVRRRFNLHAGFANGAIAPIAAPTSIVAGLYCVSVRRNLRRYARCAIAPKATIAFPGRPSGGQICVRWNFHRNATSAVLVIAASTFPAAAIAFLTCVIGNGGDRTLGVRVRPNSDEQHGSQARENACKHAVGQVVLHCLNRVCSVRASGAFR